jgi:hypothetical protein
LLQNWENLSAKTPAENQLETVLEDHPARFTRHLPAAQALASNHGAAVKIALQIPAWFCDESGMPESSNTKKNPAAVALGRLGGLKGGKARAQKLSAKQRKESARKAALARWNKPRKNS